MSVEEEGTHPPQPHASHYASVEEETRAAQMGMWLFLVNEVLLFAGLFVAYGYYRFLYPQAWQAGSAHLNLALGTVNTAVLITSSLAVAVSVHLAKVNRSRLAGLLMLGSVLFAVAFLVLKGFEYAHHFEVKALPGRYYQGEIQLPGIALFYTVYFFLTGLHALHVVIGMAVLVWIGVRALKNQFRSTYYGPVELAGMYWHLVDLVWIFLYPLLYLV